MKKLLLSLAAAAMTTTAFAAETSLDLVNVKTSDIDGTYVAAQENGAGEHYDLGAFLLDGYTFSLSTTTDKNTKPALYTGATLSTLRLYAGAKLTITAPQGSEMGTITFALSTAAVGVDATNAVTATDGVVSVNGTSMVWNGTKAANSVTINIPTGKANGKNPNIRIKSLVINTDVTDAPQGPTGYEWTKATGLPESGVQYVMVIGNQYGAPIAESYNYGRLTLTDATIANDAFTAEGTAGILFTNESNGWTMKDAYGRYLAMDAEHKTSFQLYTELNDGCYWTIEEDAKGLKMTNKLNTTCFVSQSKGVNAETQEAFWYTNIAPAENPSEYNLPILYKQGKEVSGGTPSQPVFAEWPFIKADNIEAGYMVLVCENQLATPIAKDKAFGYLNLADATINNDALRCSNENAIFVEMKDNTFTMKDAYGRYLGMDETHVSSFQLYTELNEGCYWTATKEADGVKIASTRHAESFVCKSQNKEGDWYKTLAPSKNPAQFKLPVVYILDKAGVAGVDADENAPVEYYDLQGRRVANPEKGLYIKRQGSKAVKVIL